MNIYIVLFIQLLIASATHVVAKSVVRNVDAMPLTFLRGILSAVGFLFLTKIRRIRLTQHMKYKQLLFFLGFLAVFNQFLYLYAMKYTTAANGALLYATTPIFVLILSVILYKEKLTARKVIGILMAFSGVVFIFLERDISFSADYLYGNTLMLVAVLCWTLYTTLGKKVVIEYGALHVSAFVNIVGFCILLPFGIVSLTTFSINSLTIHDWFGVLYLGLCTSIVSYLLWYYALGKIDASALAVFMNGQPVVATILSILFLNYSLTLHFLIGGCITLTGVVLTQLKKPSQSRECLINIPDKIFRIFHPN